LFCDRAALDGQPIPANLGPDMRLRPVHPVRAEFKIMAEAVIGPGAAAHAIPTLEHHHIEARITQLTGGNETREARPDHYDIDRLHETLHCVTTTGTQHNRAPPHDRLVQSPHLRAKE